MNWLKLCFFAILLSAGSVSATVEEDSLVASTTAMMSWIKARASYDPSMIDALHAPRVKIRPRQFFEQIACRGSKRNCHRIAWYNGGDIIFLRDDIDSSSVEGASNLLHELVHYVQERSDRFPEVNECNRFIRESEAYSLQKLYLIEYGNYPTFAIWLSPPLGCSIAVR